MTNGVTVIGSGISAAQCALTLAEMGIEVSIVTSAASLGLDGLTTSTQPEVVREMLHIWPLLLRATSHPRVTLFTKSEVKSITGRKGNLSVKVLKQPRYVREDLCTGCGHCEEECSVKVQAQQNGRKISHGAIHAPVPGAKGVPSAFYIDKNGIAPCRANCPLGINVQGFTALIAKGKIDKALSLINEQAPMAGILGRLCTHPCESNCTRKRIDSPVFIKGLHRYSADNAPGEIKYTRKAPANSRKEKVAIIGGGPAGLTVAWELARRGYTPTIFKSHAVIGGMLATGVPRFRLPREIREREVEGIRALGIDIKTGVTVGRDVTFKDLIERGYKAFFIGIGAEQNNKLNIPGEDLEGVSDSLSLLFALNLKVGASVGSNVIVIGGGNSAVDSARTAKRVSKGTVMILYRRTAEEMPAIREDVEEALKEGVEIDYLTSPVEILGDNGKVTGIRCVRMKLGKPDSDGRRKVEPIPGSEFVIQADHIVTSIGQRPNTPELNIKGLEYDTTERTVKIDSLTLATSIPGVFAGGDCVTGPNNVVQAMADGLRAAESIDRYLRGQDLQKERSLEKPVPVEVDIAERKPSQHKRAQMPILPLSRRKGSYEETNLGLAGENALREAGRCLNCAVCSECLECEQACELKAVNHLDCEKYLDIKVHSIINFSGKSSRPYQKPGVHNINNDDGLFSRLAQAASVAYNVALELKQECEEQNDLVSARSGPPPVPDTLAPITRRTGVFLCRCGDSISSVVDFKRVKERISRLPNVYSVQEITQSCTYDGSEQITSVATSQRLDRVVLAACRCCSLDQICFSCTDRRVMCQRNLGLELPREIAIDYINIREQCAWVHRDDPVGATEKTIELVTTGVYRAGRTQPEAYEERPITGSVFIASSSPAGLAAARNLASQGFTVTLIAEPAKSQKSSVSYLDTISRLVNQTSEQGVKTESWPNNFELSGSPGKYEISLSYGEGEKEVEAGAIILDITPRARGMASPIAAVARGDFLNRILGRQSYFAGPDEALFRRFTIQETAGIFIIAANPSDTPEEQEKKGEAIAARTAVYLGQGLFRPRAYSVVINTKLCRGCGACRELCPYFEIKTSTGGVRYSTVDPALCYGCGACISNCPTGAISQPLQSEKEIVSALEAFLGKVRNSGEAQ